MKFSFFLIPAALAVAALGSTINTGSTSTVNGSTYTVSINTFTTTGNSMAGDGGIQVTAYINGVAQTPCTFSTGTPAGCSSGGVTLSFPGTTSTDPAAGGANAFWTITNSAGAGKDLTELVINGVAADTDFDLCTFGGSNTVDFTDAGSHGSYCTGGVGGNAASQGTVGSNYGYSAIGATGGTSGIVGTATYSDLLHLSSQTVGTAVGDIWGVLTLNFSGTTFGNTDTFHFYADTDTLNSATPDVRVPEPASFSLIGAGLLALGFARKRFRRS